ncbi:MAG: hypothetical protein R3D05_09710 [Dongiaceae bacterium]
MTEQKSRAQRWQEYRASKTTLFWSCVVCVALTMVVGFGWGGWVTGGTAKDMAEQSAATARSDLAASICVKQFMDSKDAAKALANLKQTASWKREQVVEDGGWAKIAGLDKPVSGAADKCAKQLASMDLPRGDQASGDTGSTKTGTTTIQ